MVASPEGAGGNLSPRITGILAIVAIALGLFVYVNEIEGDMDRRAAADEAAKIHSGFAIRDPKCQIEDTCIRSDPHRRTMALFGTPQRSGQ